MSSAKKVTPVSAVKAPQVPQDPHLQAVIAPYLKAIEKLETEVRVLRERPVFHGKQSDIRIRLTRNIPSKNSPGKTWGSVEIATRGDSEETKYFIDNERPGPSRKDGAEVIEIYASAMR